MRAPDRIRRARAAALARVAPAFKIRSADRGHWPKSAARCWSFLFTRRATNFIKFSCRRARRACHDVFIDTLGGAIGLLVLWMVRPLAETLVSSAVMKRPLVAVVSCYVAGLLLAEIFHRRSARCLPFHFFVLVLVLVLEKLRPLLIWPLLVLVGWTNLVVRTAVISPDDLRTVTRQRRPPSCPCAVFCRKRRT